MSSNRLKISGFLHVSIFIFEKRGQNILVFTSSLSEILGESLESRMTIDFTVVHISRPSENIHIPNLLSSHVSHPLVLQHELRTVLREETRAQKFCSRSTIGVERPHIASEHTQ